MMFRRKKKEIKKRKKKKVLIVYDDMKADMEANKKLRPIVIELFLRRRNSTFHLLLIFYFQEPKTIRLNGTHYFIIKKRTSTTSIKSFV